MSNAYKHDMFEETCGFLMDRAAEFGTRSMQLSTWEDIKHTVDDETFEIHIYDIDRINLGALANVCQSLDNFYGANIAKSERETYIELIFLWDKSAPLPAARRIPIALSTTRYPSHPQTPTPVARQGLLLLFAIAVNITVLYLKNKYIV